MNRPIVTLRSSGAQLEYPEGKTTLLEALEFHQVEVEYQCRSGYCGACRCRLLKGRVAYRQQPLACINEGEILPCCCEVMGDVELGI